LDVHGAWRQGVFRQAVTEQRSYCLVFGAWRLAVGDTRQAVWNQFRRAACKLR